MNITRSVLAAGVLGVSVFATVGQAQTGEAGIAGLPLTWIAPKGTPSRIAAVFLSGDGGFADMFKDVSAALAEQGVGVAGFNSRAWLSPKKTPDETAAAVARVAVAALARFHADSLVIVGYSRGADMAPFVANRLPASLRLVLSGIAMFGLAPMVSFEFHWSDLVKDTNRESDIAVLPELVRLRGLPMLCVYGREEKESGCRDAANGLLVVNARDGGHHFDGDSKALAGLVLRLIRHEQPAKN